MTTVTLRPNGTITPATFGGAPGEVGAATTHQTVNDDSDASYSITDSFFYVTCGTSTLPAGSVTKQWRARIRHLDSGGNPKAVRLRFTKTTSPGDSDYIPTWYGTFGSFVAATTETGAYAPTTLTQTNVDDINVQVYGSSTGRTHEVYVDLMYVAIPVVAVSAVTPDPYTASNLVPVSWTNTFDADGGAQTRYEMRVFSAAQYGIGGFNPATSPATYETGQVVSSALTATTGALPTGVTYRAYIRVAQTVNGVAHWSAWAFDQFEVTVTTSDVSTVTTVATNSTGSVAVTVNRNTGTSAWNFVEVQRTTDAGTTWVDVRGATYVDATGNANVFTVTDYEVPNGATVSYRARATRILSSLPITGNWVSSSSTSWTSTATFLKVPGTPALNISTLCLASRTPYQRTRRAGVFQVLGLAAPVTVSDVRSSRFGRLDWETTTTAEAAALNNLLNGAPVVLIQFPTVMDIADTYAAITADENVFDAMVADVVRRTWSLDYVEVAAPADPLASSA